LAADTDPTRQLDFMQRTLLSRPNLEQLARLTDLDIGVTTPEDKEALFKRLAADISVTPVTLNLLTLSYRDRNPVMAKNVVQSLLTIFAEKTAGAAEPRWTVPSVSWTARSSPTEISCEPPKNGGPSWRNNTPTSFRTGPGRSCARGRKP